MSEPTAQRSRRAIPEHTRGLAECAAAAGPRAAVPTTPKWTITELVEHVGQVQHWTAEIIERRITDPARLPAEVAVLPTNPDEWPAWLSEAAQRVVDALSDDALGAPVFNAAGDGRAGWQFWLSNVLNETVVHAYDAANAAGRPHAVDADIAAALISHHLAMLTSPTWAMQRPESADAIRGTGQTLRWLATDTAEDTGAWFVERRPDGATWHRGTQRADVTVAGPARFLLLTLTRRLLSAIATPPASASTATPAWPSTGSTTPPASPTDSARCGGAGGNGRSAATRRFSRCDQPHGERIVDPSAEAPRVR